MVLSKKSSRFNIWFGTFSFVDLFGADPVHSFFFFFFSTSIKSLNRSEF